ncbi:THUMP-like domain-containing protein [Spongiivirga citrea]|uniref:Class I SAM-dependent methyltransferase n=1 Tax=Spongiivirga citrea TaxID=1481457 RepID=A0A6M0CDM9_9FLAO|nr:class I SAM-dependent methyltransferase [Spongiivirga citrea]NER15928.1 class I SAM-dependent methyltransferase [Spongiivirga citrea]
MNRHILHIEVQEFLKNYGSKDPLDLAFKKQFFEHIENKELIDQLIAKKKSKNKLPSWHRHSNIYYPTPLSIEQTSSEITAAYKASLINGASVIDITGGFGVDAFYMAKKVDTLIHCEQQKQLSEIAVHNFEQLQANNVSCVATDGIQYLKDTKSHFSWIYVDPARRDDNQQKVFFLADCIPNIPELISLLFEKADNILIKTSPLLDISIGLKELQYVQEIHIVAVKNEVKELLWILNKEQVSAVDLIAVNLDSDQPIYKTTLPLPEVVIDFAEPMQYLFEPNAAILKSGAFKNIAEAFTLKKLHQHTHLYTSNSKINFPGRMFKVVAVQSFNKKKIKSLYKGAKANVSCRNFPENPDTIKKSFGIKDGGDTYLFFTTVHDNNKVVIECIKAAY